MHFVCVLGIGGMVSGVGCFLKEKRVTFRVIAGDFVGLMYLDYVRTCHKIEGRFYKVEGIGGDKIFMLLYWDVIDEWIMVFDKDVMFMVRWLAKEEGLFAGDSTNM